MSNDRELLRLAAKAVGGELVIHGDGSTNLQFQGGAMNWNPLKDDGDALRLAVRLSLMLDTAYNGCTAVGSAALCEMLEPHNGAPCAATRRAIVRAAAEIGRESHD